MREHGEVGEFADLYRPLAILLPCHVCAVDGRRAQGLLARQRLSGRNRLAGITVLAVDTLPDGVKQRRRYVVGRKRDAHARFDQRLERRNFVFARGPELLLQQMAFLENVTVSVRSHDQPQLAHFGDLLQRERADVPKHPALRGDVDLAVHFVEHVEHIGPDRNHPYFVFRARETQFLRPLARQAGREIKSRPTGVRPGAGAQFIFARRADVDEDAADAQKVVAEAAAGKPARPRFDHRLEFLDGSGIPLRADDQRCAHRLRAALAHDLVGTQQFARDAVLFEDARRAERVVSLHRCRQRARAIVQ